MSGSKFGLSDVFYILWVRRFKKSSFCICKILKSSRFLFVQLVKKFKKATCFLFVWYLCDEIRCMINPKNVNRPVAANKKTNKFSFEIARPFLVSIRLLLHFHRQTFWNERDSNPVQNILHFANVINTALQHFNKHHSV